MTAWPDDEALSFRDLLEAEHEGKEDREASGLLTAWLDETEEACRYNSPPIRDEMSVPQTKSRALWQALSEATCGIEIHEGLTLLGGAQEFEFWRGGKKIGGGVGLPWTEESLFDRLGKRGRRPEFTPPDSPFAPTEGW